MVGMSWVLSMAVVEGLSAEQIAGRLEAELGEETASDSPSGEEAGAGPGLPAVGIHGDGRAVIFDDRDADVPVLEDARLLGRLSHGTRGCWSSSASASTAGSSGSAAGSTGPWPGRSCTVATCLRPRSTRSLASLRGSLPRRRRPIVPSR